MPFFRFWHILKALNGVVAEIAEIAKKLKRGVAWRDVAWRGVAWRGAAGCGGVWRGEIMRSLFWKNKILSNC